MVENAFHAPSKILVAVDGSEHSKKAVKMAVDCTKRWGTELWIIHVLAQTRIPEGLGWTYVPKDTKATQGYADFAQAEEMDPSEYFEAVCSSFVGEAQAKAKEAGVKKVENICVGGDPADEIIKAAEQREVDLIVIGSRGLGRFSRVILGSVSTKVTQHAHCTVMIVR